MDALLLPSFDSAFSFLRYDQSAVQYNTFINLLSIYLFEMKNAIFPSCEKQQ